MTAAALVLPVRSPAKGILDLSHSEARDFLLKPESYCSLDLPPYIGFRKLIDAVRTAIGTRTLIELRSHSPRTHDDVNHTILSNKDGKYAWRPFELIHPALYVSLVGFMTEEANWKVIVERFGVFAENVKIRCLSLPVVSTSAEKDKAEQVSLWWQNVEQRSIELSLDYEYVIETDITDCYGAIYTHSIAWALHSKSEAKRRRTDLTLIGNIIDNHIQDMRHGQTNGIPQGSVLMDFVAEMVLGLGDLELSEALQKASIDDYCVLRYRDDYRIFVNSPQVGAHIVKLLTETTTALGLKLNAAKTKASSDVVRSSIKTDKLAWIGRKQVERGLQKRLLIIHDHAVQFPNGGSLIAALGAYHIRLASVKVLREPVMPLIAIVADIAFRNPRTHAVCAALLSTLLRHVSSDEEKVAVVARVRKRFEQIPNTGLMQIWLQRVTYPFNGAINYAEPICRLVAGEPASLWNSEWISSNELKAAADSEQIVDRERLTALSPTITPKEIELFASKAGEGYYG